MLKTPKGSIFESNTILRYIARCAEGRGIYGNTDNEESLVD